MVTFTREDNRTHLFLKGSPLTPTVLLLLAPPCLRAADYTHGVQPKGKEVSAHYKLGRNKHFLIF